MSYIYYLSRIVKRTYRIQIIAGREDIPKADVVVKWTYELGKTLVPPEVVSMLPTQMYKLHQHYMRAMADCIFMQGAKIKDDDFLGGMPLYG